jgi:hypothetical protein
VLQKRWFRLLNLDQIVLKKVTAAASPHFVDKLDLDTDEMTWLINL